MQRLRMLFLAKALQWNGSRVKGVNEAARSHRTNDVLTMIVMATTVLATLIVIDFPPVIDKWFVSVLFYYCCCYCCYY